MDKEFIDTIIKVDFDLIDGRKYDLIVQSAPYRQEYDGEFKGYKIGLQSNEVDEDNPISLKTFDVKLMVDKDPELKLGDKVHVDYDKENTKIWSSSSRSGFASTKVSLKALSVVKVQKNATANN